MSLQGVDYEARCLRLEAENERLRAGLDAAENGLKYWHGIREENERLRAAVEAKGNSVDYVIRNAEREAGFKARIEAALEVCERADDDYLVDKSAVVEALKGGEDD